MHCCAVSSVAGMVKLSRGGAAPDARCRQSTTRVAFSADRDVRIINRGTVTTPVPSSAGMDASDVSVVVASATNKLAEADVAATEHVVSATTELSWLVTTAIRSGGSNGHGDVASDAMNVVGIVDRMRASSDAVVIITGGVVRTWPHMVHDPCTNNCVPGGACSVTFTDAGIAVLPVAPAFTVSDQVSAVRRVLRTDELTSSTSQVVSVVAPPLPAAGALNSASMFSGTAAYANTMGGGVTHDSVNCRVDVDSVGRRMRSPVGTHVHSAATVSGAANGQAAVDIPGRVATMLEPLAPTVIVAPLVVDNTDAYGDADAISAANAVDSGSCVDSEKMAATHDTNDAASAPAGSGTVGVLESVIVNAGSELGGTITAGRRATVPLLHSAANTTTLTFSGVASVAVRPTPSRHRSDKTALEPPGARNPTFASDTLARVAPVSNGTVTEVSPASCTMASYSPSPTPGAANPGKIVDTSTDKLHITTPRAGAASSTAGSHGSTTCAPDGHTVREGMPPRNTTV